MRKSTKSRDHLKGEYSSKNQKPFDELLLKDTPIWRCSLGHEWEASVNNRVHAKSGCPYCANQKAYPGYNDLATTHPDLATQWHPTKNDITPSQALPGSSKKVWWVGECGHEWEANISDRTRKGKGRGCPYCSNKKILVGFNDLATTHPHLAAQFSPNNTITPQEVTAGSDKEILWVCDQGHEWLNLVYKRKAGRGCSVCAGKTVVVGANDIASNFPELIPQWSNRNLLTPQEVSAGSNTPIIWICERGHEWETSPHVRISRSEGVKTGCPICSNRRVLLDFNDMITTHPLLAKEWSKKNPIEAHKIVAGSRDSYWWECDKGHEWKAVVDNRARGAGCPHCARKISRAETAVADYIKSLLPDTEVLTNVRNVISPKELDIYIPAKKIAIEFNGLFWHTEGQGKDRYYHHNKWKDCQEKGIQLIQIWEDQWRDREDVVKRMLAHKLGASQEPKVFGRQTTVEELNSVQARAFLDAYHIQGSVTGSHYLGLRKKSSNTDDAGDIVAVMVLKRQGEDMLLARYATSAHVPGGQSKLVKYAERTFGYRNLITFADLEVSDGNLYEATGFIRDKELRPDYRYLYEGDRQHKFGFRLVRFRTDPELVFEEGLSERELALLNGIERVWDTGKIRYVKPHPDTQQ